jgi:hypothetical protein
MSDTPRTDKVTRDYGYRDASGTWNQQYLVDPVHMKELERENARLREALKSCAGRLEHLNSREAEYYSKDNKFWIDEARAALKGE